MLQSKENTSSLGELSYNISFVRKKVRSNFFNSDKIVRLPPFEQNQLGLRNGRINDDPI